LNCFPESCDCAGTGRGIESVGAAAVDLVVQQLEHNERGIPEVPKTVLIDLEWVDGKTVIEQARKRASLRFR
jgi:LacI family transcriptional regulator